ncbi:MAG TPA: hypothetical protein VMT16_02765 [Thermoanaerobaculia bacterium]|nr:hypothetical protein [Thermoanaerobaculia bacterium]
MLVLDANLWIAAFDPADAFHDDSVELFRVAAVRGLPLAAAERLGVDCRLRGADALYAATAAQLGCPWLSWDAELVTRGGALSPRDWLAAHSDAPDTAGSGRPPRRR